MQALPDDSDEPVALHAGFALIAAAATYLDVEWDERAAALVRSHKPDAEAAMRAERAMLLGDATEAQRILLPHSGQPASLRRVRDYAALAGEWKKVKVLIGASYLSTAAISATDSPWQRLTVISVRGRTPNANTGRSHVTPRRRLTCAKLRSAGGRRRPAPIEITIRGSGRGVVPRAPRSSERDLEPSLRARKA